MAVLVAATRVALWYFGAPPGCPNPGKELVGVRIGIDRANPLVDASGLEHVERGLEPGDDTWLLCRQFVVLQPVRDNVRCGRAITPKSKVEK